MAGAQTTEQRAAAAELVDAVTADQVSWARHGDEGLKPVVISRCLRFTASFLLSSRTNNPWRRFQHLGGDLRLLNSDGARQRHGTGLALGAAFRMQTPPNGGFPQVRQSPAQITVPRAPGALLQMNAKISELMPGALITNIFREQNRDVLCQMWIFSQRTRHHSWTGGKRHKKNIPNRSGNTLHHLVGPMWFPDKAEAVFNECTDESVLRSSAKTVVSHLPIHTISFTQESVD